LTPVDMAVLNLLEQADNEPTVLYETGQKEDQAQAQAPTISSGSQAPIMVMPETRAPPTEPPADQASSADDTEYFNFGGESAISVESSRTTIRSLRQSPYTRPLGIRKGVTRFAPQIPPQITATARVGQGNFQGPMTAILRDAARSAQPILAANRAAATRMSRITSAIRVDKSHSEPRGFHALNWQAQPAPVSQTVPAPSASDDLLEERRRNIQLQNELLETQIGYWKLKMQALQMEINNGNGLVYQDEGGEFIS